MFADKPLSRMYPVGLVFAAWSLFTFGTLGLTPLFDYDETVYAQTALDMMRHGEWIVPMANGMQFFEKPPFVYYLMDLSFALFGPSAFSARLPSAIFILLTALLLYRFGSRLKSRPFGLATALVYLSMLETGVLAHAAILDPVLNFFITASLLAYADWLRRQRKTQAVWVAAMSGIAVSIKGPVGMVIPLLVIFIDQLLHRSLMATFGAIPWGRCLAVFLLCATPWYLMIALIHGPDFLYEFIMVHNIGRALQPMQGHGGGWHYYLVVFAVSVLPWLAALPRSLRFVAGNSSTTGQEPDELSRIIRLGWIWCAAVIVLFTFAQTKLPHYISSIYPGVALAITAAFWRPVETGNDRRIRLATVLLLLPVALLLLTFPWVFDWLGAFVTHPRAVAVLSQDIRPGMDIPLAGLMLVAIMIWLLKSRRALLGQMIVLGLVLQATLLLPLGGFAGRLLQGPQSEIAASIRDLPADVPVLSFALNAPSISFASGRNYRMIDGMAEIEALHAEHKTFALFLRQESASALPDWLVDTAPVVRRGGYLLYIIGEARR